MPLPNYLGCKCLLLSLACNHMTTFIYSMIPLVKSKLKVLLDFLYCSLNLPVKLKPSFIYYISGCLLYNNVLI